MSALEFEGELRVIDPQAVQDGRVEVVHMDRVFGDVVRELVGLAIAHATLNSTAGEPDGKASRVMIASVIFGRQFPLAVNSSSKLAAPHDERVVEQSALLEVENQRGGGLIGIFALTANRFGQVEMLIPATVEELDEASSTFGQSSREQTVRGERARLARVGAVQIEDVFRLFRCVGQFGDR